MPRPAPPRPFYESDVATIYHGSAPAVLAELAAAGVVVDMVTADPPYGVAFQSRFRPKARRLAKLTNDADPAAADALARDIVVGCCSVLRRRRHLYLFGPASLRGLPFGSVAELVWDKGAPGLGDLTQPYGPAHERLQFAVHLPTAAERADGRGELAARLRRGSVLRVPRLVSGQVKRHGTEKPVALMRQLVESSSMYDELVLDPCCGSGSALVAAVLEGRRAIGIDVDRDHCATAAARLAALPSCRWGQDEAAA